jgi:hypothetical protein
MPLRAFLTEIGVFKKDRTDGTYKLTAGRLLFFGKIIPLFLVTLNSN